MGNPMSAGRALAIVGGMVVAIAVAGDVIRHWQAAAPEAVAAPAPPVAAPVEALPADDEDAIAAAITDLTSRGWIYDYRVHAGARTLRLVVPPGVIAEGYGDEAVRRICGRLWFHGVTTIGGQRPIVRLVRQINDWNAIATAECP